MKPKKKNRFYRTRVDRWKATNKQFALSALIVVVCLSLAHQSNAQRFSADKLGTISFSRLLVRVDGDMEIGIAPGDYRVFIIEALRNYGFNVKGAENILFDQDKSDEARFILGATLTELECTDRDPRRLRGVCDMGVEWQLFDRKRDTVVYKVMTRSFMNVNANSAPEKVLKTLVMGTLTSLMRRQNFIDAQINDTPELDTTSYPLAHFKACSAPAVHLPEDIDTVLQASALVKAGDGVGSGFFISDDGVLITAAHVVEHKDVVEIKLNNGTEGTARVLRTNKEQDVAVLQTDIRSGNCLVLNTDPIKTGISLYAVGSPATEELAFSVSQGIVSGVRQVDSKWFVQTDASLSPGNSGGPMVDEEGRVIALVSWKISRQGYEGLSFGVPMSTVADALKIQQGTETTLLAMTATPAPTNGAPQYPVIDSPDMTRFQARAQQRQMALAEETRKRKEAREAQQAYERVLEEWEKDVEPIKKKRRPYLAWGTTLNIVGLAGLITSGVLKAQSSDANDTANQYYDDWATATNATVVTGYEELYTEQIDRRDKLNVAAIILLSAGGASIITGTILMIAAPNLPDKPDRSERLLTLRPLLSPNEIGVTGTF